MKKILAFTSIRSDYDLMSPLYNLLNDDENIDFKLIVSGAHLSKAFGYSVEQIRADKFDVLIEIETLLNSDTSIGRLKSASLLLQNSLDTISKFSPDLMMYAGDREDVLMYGMIGGYLNIPTLHFFAGDHVEDGYIDNPIRHATSKLSTAHFATINEHKKRLIRMGEDKKRIFVVGNISLDKFQKFKALTITQIKNHFNLNWEGNDFALMIFHPITQEKDDAGIYCANILKNLEKRNIRTFVSYPNVDPGNQKILDVIEQYKDNKNFVFYKNLDRHVFMSIYKHSQFIIGNSSSGICEAATFKIPAINVGLRQTGRFADENVIFCSANFNEIGMSIDMSLSKGFQSRLLKLENSYGNGHSAQKAYDIIVSTNFNSMIEKTEDPLKISS